MGKNADHNKSLEIYGTERAAIVAQKNDTTNSIDKLILTISSAGIGLLANQHDKTADTCLGATVTAVIFWILAIISTLASLHLSKMAADKQISDWDEWINSNQTVVAFDPNNVWVARINIASSSLFVLGTMAAAYSFFTK